MMGTTVAWVPIAIQLTTSIRINAANVSMKGSMEYTNVFTTSEGKTLHSISCGTGTRPFHFLHANGFCSGTYLPFFNYLETDYRIIATDIPGHGDSTPHGTDRIRHWNLFVDDIRQVMVKTLPTPAIGAGHSLGAVTTLLLAARYPELFSHLILIDPVIFPPPFLFVTALIQKTGLIRHTPLPQKARRRKSVFDSTDDAFNRFKGRGLFKTWPESFVRAYCDHGLKANPEGSWELKCNPETEAQIFESVLTDIWNYPPEIKCPVLLIRGNNSDTFFPSAARRLQKKIKDCTLVNVNDAGHFVVMETPDTCHTLIRQFIVNNA